MSNRLPWPVRLAYAAPAFALAVVGIPVYVYLPKFYTDVVGLPVGLLGSLILILRVTDALTDPLIGFWSDHSRTRWGRRKPFILLAVLPLVLAIYALFVPPELNSDASLYWFGGSLFLLFLCWTLVAVPYEALGPDLCRDYHERTAVLGIREGSLLVGTLTAAVVPAVLGVLLGQGTAELERQRFEWMALLYCPLILLACTLCLWKVPEPSHAHQRHTPGTDWKALLNNRPFLVLLGAYTVSAFGSNLPATLILYYVEYVLQSSHADLFLLIYFVVGIFCLPLWILGGRQWGKKPAWLGAMALNTGAFSGVFFLGPGDETLYGILVALSGLGLGGVMVLPASMQADTIDIHEQLTGNRREGKYIGLWSVARKLAAALGVGLGLLLLGLGDYQPNQIQSEQTVFRLRLLYALVPCLCNAAALLIGVFYPLTEERHREVLKATRDRFRISQDRSSD